MAAQPKNIKNTLQNRFHPIMWSLVWGTRCCWAFLQQSSKPWIDDSLWVSLSPRGQLTHDGVSQGVDDSLLKCLSWRSSIDFELCKVKRSPFLSVTKINYILFKTYKVESYNINIYCIFLLILLSFQMLELHCRSSEKCSVQGSVKSNTISNENSLLVRSLRFKAEIFLHLFSVTFILL